MAIQQATLTSPDKKFKTVVNVGSSEASQLQSKGWGLGDAGLNIISFNQALTQGGNLAPTPAPTAPAAGQAPTAPTPTAPTPAAPAPQGQQPVPQPQVPVAPQATAPPAPAVQPTQPAQNVGTIPFIPGLNEAQIQSINNLVASGRQFNPTDLANWNYATNNAPVPGSQPTQTNAPAASVDLNNLNTQVEPDTSAEFDLSSFDTSEDGLTSDPITTSLLAQYGIKPPAATGNPVQDYASTYNQLLTSMGLTDIKSEFNRVQKEYSALQNELNDKISGINDDPWLAEGVRVGQIKRMQDRYQGKLQILNDQQKLYDSLYQQGVQQAQYVANAAFQQQQFNSQQAFNIAELALKEQEARASLQSAKLRDKLAIAQEMRMVAAQDSEDAQRTTTNSLNSLKTLADMFGGSIFDNLSTAEKRKWEESAGLPKGTLDYLGQTIEQQRLAADLLKNSTTINNGKLVTINGKNYIQNQDGSFSEPSLPDAIPTGEKVQKATDVIDQIDAILNNPNLNSAIGPVDSQWPSILRSGARNDVDAAIQQLIAGVAIENLSLLKGPMSDKDVAFIKQASSGLNTNMSEEGFRNRLLQLRSKFEEIRGKATTEDSGTTGTTLPALNKTYSSLDKLLSERPEYQSYVVQQINQGNDEAAILRSLSTGKPITFNSGMGGTPTAQNIQLGSRLAQVNNNPGNLRFAGQTGATQGQGGFARFPSPQAGYQALLNQIKLDASRNLTLSQFVNKYAPPSENDTKLYIQQMSKATGASPSTPLKNIDLNTLGKAMALKESSTRVS